MPVRKPKVNSVRKDYVDSAHICVGLRLLHIIELALYLMGFSLTLIEGKFSGKRNKCTTPTRNDNIVKNILYTYSINSLTKNPVIGLLSEYTFLCVCF